MKGERKKDTDNQFFVAGWFRKCESFFFFFFLFVLVVSGDWGWRRFKIGGWVWGTWWLFVCGRPEVGLVWWARGCTPHLLNKKCFFQNFQLLGYISLCYCMLGYVTRGVSTGPAS